ncbi:hypothetical protein GCM10010335_67970 [Streptomyces galbus]|nr:hypothetical protein GCM10010335_67970 [Streptomyces galbus]
MSDVLACADDATSRSRGTVGRSNWAPKRGPPAHVSAEEKPLDPLDFPQTLHDAQSRAAELHAQQERLPWSREPHEGWPAVEERGQERAGREP